MMCAASSRPTGSCKGDSGGPLIASDPARNGSMSLIGVVSWGSTNCADSPGIYSEVSHFTEWLSSQMSDMVTCSHLGDVLVPWTGARGKY